MFVRRVSLHRVEVPTRKNNAPALMDVIVGRFIAGCCLLLAADVAHNSYSAALICVLSAIVAAAAVPVSRRRRPRPRRRSSPVAPAPQALTDESSGFRTAEFYAGG